MLKTPCRQCGSGINPGDGINFFTAPGVPAPITSDFPNPDHITKEQFCDMVCVDYRWIDMLDNSGFFERNPMWGGLVGRPWKGLKDEQQEQNN